MTESDLVKELLCAASERGHRLFRNNTAQAWAGVATKVHDVMMMRVYPGDVVVRKAYPIKAGLCVGSPDLVGLTSTGRFLGVECKSLTGRIRPEQESFIEMVNKLGGIGIIARTLDDFTI